MFELLREEQEVIDAPGAELLECKRGQVEFLNVSFGYTPEKIVLRNINFTVPAGKTTALVGPSGAGKSTIMRLLFRFYDVEEGAIVIDGQNLKTVKQESLRNAIGISGLIIAWYYVIVIVINVNITIIHSIFCTLHTHRRCTTGYSIIQQHHKIQYSIWSYRCT